MAHLSDSPEQSTSAATPGSYVVEDTAGAGPALWRVSPEDGATRILMFTRRETDRVDPAVWPVLAGVLTQDEETVERVAQAISASIATGLWRVLTPDRREAFRIHARAALSGLLPGTEAES